MKIGSSINLDGAEKVSLSSDGKTVAIGAYVHDYYSGRVRVYKRSKNDVWLKVGNDIDGVAEGDESGWSLSLSSDGKTVAIGAPYNDDNGNDSGYVRVFKLSKNEDVWVQIGDDIVGEAADDQSGWSVSLSSDGKNVAIGAPYNNENGDHSGHVTVYKLSKNDVWVQIGDDIDGYAVDNLLGSSVSLSSDGKTVAIGGEGDDDYQGHVRVFKLSKNEDVWVQIGDDIDGDAVNDMFGSSVSLSSDGKTVAIGSYAHDYYSGHVRVFKLNSSDVWEKVGDDIDGVAESDLSGYSVSLSSDGKTVAIGAPLNDGNNDDDYDSGHVRVYKLSKNEDVWVQVGDDIVGEAADDQIGEAVSLSSDGKTVAAVSYGSSVDIYELKSNKKANKKKNKSPKKNKKK